MEDILRGAFGILVLLAILYAFSSNRKRIDWKLVLMALGLQLILGLAILKIGAVRTVFDFISSFFVLVLDYTKEGSDFMFGGLLDTSNVGYIFAVQVLPTFLFFSALSSILYYFGILQAIIYGMAKVMIKVMRLSGAESMAAAANVFIGQTEAPLVIKPYLEKMTKSELFCLMVGGMATIAGGVLAAYIGFLGGEDRAAQQEFATHLLTASIMSAPAAILAAKMLFPEEEEIDQEMEIPKEQIGDNLLEAISNGTTDGLKLAINVGAMLIVFTALVAMVNSICSSTIGEWVGWSLADGSMSFFGATFSEGKDMFLMGATSVVSDSLLIEQAIPVFDTLSKNSMDLNWSAEMQQWQLINEGNTVGSLAHSADQIDRVSLNMYVNMITDSRFSGFNLEYLLGLILSPIAWVLGTPWNDAMIMGQLLGKKTIINEFVAYADIPKVSMYLSEKSKIIATYALCGFANFASIGIQIGGIGAIAPGKRKLLAQFGVKALIGGTIACFLTATIAGMLV